MDWIQETQRMANKCPLSCQEIADRSGVNYKLVERVRKGNANPTVKNLNKLHNWLWAWESHQVAKHA